MVVLPVSTTSELFAKVLAFTEPLTFTAAAVAFGAFFAPVLESLAMLPEANVFPSIAGNLNADSFADSVSLALTLNTTAHIRHTIPAQWRKSKLFFLATRARLTLFFILFGCFIIVTI